jgi:rhodanese-related sulfurtransferase
VAEPITHERLRELLDGGAQLVEVLPEQEYAEEHLPGAINLPLKRLDSHSVAALDRTKAVVVYCWDGLCDMSPRAASRLDGLGFEHVYDYMPGKVDWLARGLPREGENATEPRAIDFAHRDAVTCRPDEPLGQVRRRMNASPYGFAFVLGDGGVLLGRIRKTALKGRDPSVHAATTMEPGPSTVRANAAPVPLRQRLKRDNLTTAVITDPDGRLLGLVHRDDLPADA